MRCRSCNVLNMHALGKRVTQISMIARAVAGVNEVNCLGMLGCGMWGQLLIGQGASLLLARRWWGNWGVLKLIANALY